jgi:hypothetical protein
MPALARMVAPKKGVEAPVQDLPMRGFDHHGGREYFHGASTRFDDGKSSKNKHIHGRWGFQYHS